MKFRQILLSLIFLLSCSFILQSADKKNILLLNSYHKGLQWTDDVNSGINQGLNELNIDKEIYTEFLDVKRFTNPTFKKELFHYYKSKYAKVKFDVIIVSDDFAVDFLIEYRDSLFGKVPVVFCGINMPHAYPNTYTGIIESVAYVENLKLIEQLHPEYSKIYFIVDNSITGNIIYDRAYSAYISLNREFRYEFLRNYTFKELNKKVSSLDENAILFLTAFTKDRNGNYCSYDDIIANLYKYSKVPVYGAWDFYLGKGIVGGKLISGFDQGYRASLMANRILNGENISDVNIISSESTYTFDYDLLHQYHIRKRNLPENSKIINHPLEFITANRQQTIFFSIIFLLLVITIFILVGYIIYRKRKIKEIRRYNKSIELANERLQLAKERVEESDRLKSSFLANISHELRSPMNGIVGFSKLIMSSEDLDKETQTAYLNIIQESGMLLLNLVNDIIDLSKIEAKQLQVKYSEFKLAELIDEILSFFRSEKVNQGKDHISIIAEKEYDFRNISIYSDGSRIRQVLYNLLSNALKFTKKGSIKFGYYIETPSIVFFVKDTGIGLSQEEQELIFDMFRQADEKTSRMFGGAGIGLTISKGIVESLKGRIWVESQKEDIHEGIEGGSTFYFTVPFNPVSIHHKKEDLNSAKKTHFEWPGNTILIVEDSIVSYQLLTKFLKSAKVSFVHASDGEQAVEICNRNQQIDLVLMDIQLPIMDGLEATRLIKEKMPELPIIAQTANALNDDKEKIIAAGCDDYISKPINRIELQGKIDQFLRSDK